MKLEQSFNGGTQFHGGSTRERLKKTRLGCVMEAHLRASRVTARGGPSGAHFCTKICRFGFLTKIKILVNSN